MKTLQISLTDQKILDKLASFAEELDRIEKQMNEPEIASNPARITQLSKDHGRLRNMVEPFYEFQKIMKDHQGAVEMLESPDCDAETRMMAEEELDILNNLFTEKLNLLKEKLVMSDDAAIDSVIMEIRAGTGGEEAALFAGDLYNMYMKYCENQGWQVEPMSFSPSDMGGYREIILGIKGDGAWSKLGYEGGGHRVQRVPETESQGRIHTSAATVAVLPEPEEVEIDLKKDEVIEHVCRSSGPGGQNVNKVNSAIKLEHIPTGITVSMQDEKSQHKNRAKAWRILRSRVYEKYMQDKHAERSATRKNMIGSGDRSQRIRTYNFPQNRVTDHRINLTLYSLDKFILGDMDDMIAGLVDYDKQQRLANL